MCVHMPACVCVVVYVHDGLWMCPLTQSHQGQSRKSLSPRLCQTGCTHSRFPSNRRCIPPLSRELGSACERGELSQSVPGSVPQRPF